MPFPTPRALCANAQHAPGTGDMAQTSMDKEEGIRQEERGRLQANGNPMHASLAECVKTMEKTFVADVSVLIRNKCAIRVNKILTFVR